ncbi:MAG: UbiA family prenyltransferase [Phycisphaerae bacterium]
MFRHPQRTDELVSRSYDRIASGYERAWTDHNRGLSVEMLDQLGVQQGAECIDLTCGTGSVAGELKRRGAGRVVGVDASEGMLAEARKNHHDCTFIQSDAVDYLRSCPAQSADVVTCAWGLGYTRPWAVIRQIARVLRPGGRVGIIDNGLFSLAEVLWSAMLAFAERPSSLAHVMNFRFLPTSGAMATLMRLAGFSVRRQWSGKWTYFVRDGRAAIERLTATGAAAGFEFAATDSERDAVFDRFAQILEARFATSHGVPITHRYIAAIGQKPISDFGIRISDSCGWRTRRRAWQSEIRNGGRRNLSMKAGPLFNLARLCRLYYAAPMSLAYLLTVYYARGGDMAGQWPAAALSTALLAMVIAGGYALNDYYDRRVDLANAPARPIPAGRVSPRAAMLTGVLLIVAGAGLARLCSLWFFVGLTWLAVALTVYDILSKRLGPAKQVAVAALMTSIYPLAIAQAGTAAGPRAATLAVFPAWLFLTSLGYETLKDIRDVSGDPLIAGRPSPIRRRPGMWRAISRIAVLCGAALLVGPFILGCKWVYMAGAGVAMALAVAAAFVPVRTAIRLVYAECFIVGLAAALDVLVFGV